MDLTTLSRDELREEFLKANEAYVDALMSTPVELRTGKPFLLIRMQLHAVLDELKRRRDES